MYEKLSPNDIVGTFIAINGIKMYKKKYISRYLH